MFAGSIQIRFFSTIQLSYSPTIRKAFVNKCLRESNCLTFNDTSKVYYLSYSCNVITLY